MTFSTGTLKKVYYVSNSGSDSNNGTSENTPFKTIAKVNEVLAELDSNIDAYLTENMGTQYGEGNKYYFIF